MAKAKRKKKGTAKMRRRPRYQRGYLDRGRSDNGWTEKLSEVLVEFIEPRQGAETSDEYRQLIGIGALAWNLALMGGERQQFLEEALSCCSDDTVSRGGLEEILEELIGRKQRYFAHDRRFILDYDLTPKAGQLHLTVLSALSAPS